MWYYLWQHMKWLSKFDNICTVPAIIIVRIIDLIFSEYLSCVWHY